MKKHEENDCIFFAEWVPYDDKNVQSREEATLYLRKWKKYLLWKLRADLCDYEPYDGQVIDEEKRKSDPDGWYEHWTDRPAMFSCPSEYFSTLGLKFCLKKKFPYQISTDGIVNI